MAAMLIVTPLHSWDDPLGCHFPLVSNSAQRPPACLFCCCQPSSTKPGCPRGLKSHRHGHATNLIDVFNRYVLLSMPVVYLGLRMVLFESRQVIFFWHGFSSTGFGEGAGAFLSWLATSLESTPFAVCSNRHRRAAKCRPLRWIAGMLFSTVYWSDVLRNLTRDRIQMRFNVVNVEAG